MPMEMMEPVRLNIARRPSVVWRSPTWEVLAWETSHPSWVRHQLTKRVAPMDAWQRREKGKAAQQGTGERTGGSFTKHRLPNPKGFPLSSGGALSRPSGERGSAKKSPLALK